MSGGLDITAVILTMMNWNLTMNRQAACSFKHSTGVSVQFNYIDDGWRTNQRRDGFLNPHQTLSLHFNIVFIVQILRWHWIDINTHFRPQQLIIRLTTIAINLKISKLFMGLSCWYCWTFCAGCDHKLNPFTFYYYF